MALHDTRYKHYEGVHLGIWRRRWVIASHSLRSSLQNKWMRHLLTVCWAFSLALAGILFMVGQLLVPDSMIVRWIGQMGPRLRGVAEGLTTWLADHPEVSVSTTQNLLLYFATNTLLTFSLISIALILPHLITRDISSKAIIIYTSKALGRVDYLLGKWGAVFGLLIMTWLGPLLVGCDDHALLPPPPPPVAAKTITVAQLAARLNMRVARNTGTHAVLQDAANCITLFADPDGAAFVNGRAVPCSVAASTTTT